MVYGLKRIVDEASHPTAADINHRDRNSSRLAQGELNLSVRIERVARNGTESSFKLNRFQDRLFTR